MPPPGARVDFWLLPQETRGKPCRLILDCWWERFDVRAFLAANLAEEDMAQVERTGAAPPPSKVLSLVEMIQQAKDRIAVEKPDGGDRRERE